MIDLRLQALFLELVRIDAPSGNEHAMMRYLMSYFSALGLDAYLDDTGKRAGIDTTNVVVKIAGGGDFFLAAHQDTVRSTAELRPVIHEDRITSDGTTILGADNRAGMAAILYAVEEAVRMRKTIRPCTLVFTVCEETSMAGSQHFEPASTLTHGFTFDSSLPPGSFVNRSCGAIAFTLEVIGRQAHAGLAPEKGVNAIRIASEALSRFPYGRIDEETLANIGTIEGGSAINVVPDLVKIIGEIRAEDTYKAETMMMEVLQDFRETAKAYGGQVRNEYVWDFIPYSIDECEIPCRRLKEVTAQLGLPFKGVKSMGGSDAHWFNHKGVKTINLGIGAQNPHQDEEFIRLQDLQAAANIASLLITK